MPYTGYHSSRSMPTVTVLSLLVMSRLLGGVDAGACVAQVVWFGLWVCGLGSVAAFECFLRGEDRCGGRVGLLGVAHRAVQRRVRWVLATAGRDRRSGPGLRLGRAPPRAVLEDAARCRGVRVTGDPSECYRGVSVRTLGEVVANPRRKARNWPVRSKLVDGRGESVGFDLAQHLDPPSPMTRRDPWLSEHWSWNSARR